jgi:hypothetical protein
MFGVLGAYLSLYHQASWRRIAGVVTFVSVISYSMYLLHLTVVQDLLLPPSIEALAQVCWRCSQSNAVHYLLYWSSCSVPRSCCIDASSGR